MIASLTHDTTYPHGRMRCHREKLQERLAKLSGGIAVLKIGGASEVEVSQGSESCICLFAAALALLTTALMFSHMVSHREAWTGSKDTRVNAY